MKLSIRADHFDLTPSIRLNVTEALNKAGLILPESATVHVLLDLAGPGIFYVAMNTHLNSKPVVVSRTGTDFYATLSNASHAFTRSLISRRHRRVAQRRTDQLLNHL